jgi:hypothetical protein
MLTRLGRYVTMKELADMAGLPYHVVHYAVTRGRIIEPSHQNGRTRRVYYTWAEAQDLLPTLKQEAEERRSRRGAPAAEDYVALVETYVQNKEA